MANGDASGVVVRGQIIEPYRTKAWTKNSLSGELEVRADSIRISARGAMKRASAPLTLSRHDLVEIERVGWPVLRRWGRGFRFRTRQPESDGITFFAYGHRARLLERLVIDFFGEAAVRGHS